MSTKLLPKQKIKFRIRKKVSGTAAIPRLTVYRSNKNIYAQLIDDETGKTLASASSNDKSLKGTKQGTQVDIAKTVGSTLAQKAKAVQIEKVVFDRNGYRYHGRVKSLADAAREAGLQF